MAVHGVNAVLELLRSETPVERVLLHPGPRTGAIRDLARHRAVPCDPADRAALDRAAGTPAHQGAVRILHSACEKLVAAANYRITLSGEGQGPAGAVLRAVIKHDERDLSKPKLACADWKTCQRQPDEPEKTRWRVSVLSAGAAPTHATVSLDPERAGSANAAYAVARVELDCLRP